MAPIVKRSARAILIDDKDRLVLIKRTRPGQPVYWTTPGGGIEPDDPSPEEALRRELHEELGATAGPCQQVFLFSSPKDDGVAVQHVFVARLIELDLARRDGPEFDDPSRGGYDIDFIELCDEAVAATDLKPEGLKEFILANRDALLDAASA
ncbi:NUDIX hydrolase [Actinoallomurus purpureus]|uniref:NUDIX domain-containing protein n=1 Tax=Actinoallomurus purpureus TaxID=478114 RepID=UPI0020931DFF|nr:NUDIX hydrolase [Actinoallomurus purpureus]MCO6003767.1 NUDIX hydrolase [Actinoallomurus purpureus]